VNELRQRNRENGRFATPPERQVSLTRISWNLNSELLTAYSTLTFTCTAIIDTWPRALCGSIKIRTTVQLNSWAQPLSSLSSMSLFPVAQYQDNPLHFLGRYNCNKHASVQQCMFIIPTITEPPAVLIINVIITGIISSEFSAPVQAGLRAPPSLLYNGYLVSLPGVERPGRGVKHPSETIAEVKERVSIYIYSSGPS